MSAYDPKPGEAEAVVPTLSPAQRRAVHSGALDPKARGYWPLREALWSRGLFTTANRLDVLTPLGEVAQGLILRGAQ